MAGRRRADQRTRRGGSGSRRPPAGWRAGARRPVPSWFAHGLSAGGFAEDALVPHADRQALRVEILEEGDRILPGDPEQILHVLGGDLPALAEERGDPGLRLAQRLGVEIE